MEGICIFKQPDSPMHTYIIYQWVNSAVNLDITYFHDTKSHVKPNQALSDEKELKNFSSGWKK
jgi:hypothetical protein